MHELGIMYRVVDTVLRVAEAQKLQEVESIVLEVGTSATVVPRYLLRCFPAAADGTLLERTRLKIERPEGTAFNIKEIVAR
jgi:hydrogenase nickel incorporation protein HypA/HybF